jgi:hypothetical protein
MLERTSAVLHPSGISVRTPLLIPSFSSKGFRFTIGDDDREVSEAAAFLEVAYEFLSESMLVSAFDIYHGYIPPITHAMTEITVVDSGGYETSSVQDLSSIRVDEANRKLWTLDTYLEVLNTWPDHVPGVFVSFDSPDIRVSLGAQIAQARDSLSRFRTKHLVTILVKPEAAGNVGLDVDNIVGRVRELRDFDIVGLTEKEAGDSTFERMVSIARIRQALDRDNNNAPIHVFGSLDPITVPLYFLAGAEIFDGLSWLRYGFDRSGTSAYYRIDHGAREIGIDRSDDLVQAITMQGNLNVITTIRNRMRRFESGRDFAKFEGNAGLFAEADELLRTRIT